MDKHWNYLGNQWAVSLLRGQIEHDALRHAYLFTGPAGVGRRSLALRLAQAVNCEQPPANGQYCNQCRACKGIAKMQHPDLHLIALQEGDRKIKIDAVRAVRRSLALTPYEANMQIALFINFDLATEQAANALLKTLEEPSERVLLLLTAESSESLPATIASRCEVLRLRTLPREQLSQDLLAIGDTEKDKAELAARLSGGRPGLANRLLKNEEEMLQRKEWVEDLMALISADRLERFAYADGAAKDRDSLNSRLEIWLGFWREILLSKHNQKAEIIYFEQQNDFAVLLKRLKKGEITDFVEKLQTTLQALKGNVNTRLTMESLVLSMPKLT